MSTAVVNGTTPETFLLPPNCINEQWCRDWYGYINYIPSLAGNAFFLTAITIGLFAQTYLGVRYRAWTFTGPMIVGILLEIVGYGGRIGMHGDIFINSWFIMVKPSERDVQHANATLIVPLLSDHSTSSILRRSLPITVSNHCNVRPWPGATKTTYDHNWVHYLRLPLASFASNWWSTSLDRFFQLRTRHRGGHHGCWTVDTSGCNDSFRRAVHTPDVRHSTSLGAVE